MAPSRGHITLGWVTCSARMGGLQGAARSPTRDHYGERRKVTPAFLPLLNRCSIFQLSVISAPGETSPVIWAPSDCRLKMKVWRCVSGSQLVHVIELEEVRWDGRLVRPLPVSLPLLNTEADTASVMVRAAACWRLPNSRSAHHPALPGDRRGG